MNVSNGFKRAISSIVGVIGGLFGGGGLAKLVSNSIVKPVTPGNDAGTGLSGCGPFVVFLFLLLPATALVGFVSYFISSKLMEVFLQKKLEEPVKGKAVRAVGSTVIMAVSIVLGLVLAANLTQLFRTFIINNGVFSVTRPGPDSSQIDFQSLQIRIIINFFATSAFAATSLIGSIILINKGLHKFFPRGKNTQAINQDLE